VKISKLEEIEMSLDDLDSEDTSYLLEDRSVASTLRIIIRIII